MDSVTVLEVRNQKSMSGKKNRKKRKKKSISVGQNQRVGRAGPFWSL